MSQGGVVKHVLRQPRAFHDHDFKNQSGQIIGIWSCLQILLAIIELD